MRIKLFSLCLLLFLSLFPVARASEPEEIVLWPGVAPGSEGYTEPEVVEGRGENNRRVTKVSRPTLTVYLPDEGARTGAAAVICPGGAYAGLSIDKEGHDMARWFRERGVVGAVLKYRHGGGPFQHPVPLSDAQRAMRIIRSRAEAWGVKPDAIGIVGFSAGGHLASSLGTHFDAGQAESEDAVEGQSCRPDFLVLVYPVISMDASITHGGSRQNLLGDDPPSDLVELMSNELQVTAETPPTFLIHASDDRTVPVANSLRFYEAAHKQKIPAELHVFESGGHGFGFYRDDRPVDRWPDLLEGWLKWHKWME